MGKLRRYLDHHFVVVTLLLLEDQRLNELYIFSRWDPVRQEKQNTVDFELIGCLFSRFENRSPSCGTSVSPEVSLSCPRRGPSKENDIMSACINGITWSSSLHIDDSSVVCPSTRQAYQTLTETWIRAYSTIFSGIDNREMSLSFLFHYRIVNVIAVCLVPVDQTSSCIILIISMRRKRKEFETEEGGKDSKNMKKRGEWGNGTQRNQLYNDTTCQSFV